MIGFAGGDASGRASRKAMRSGAMALPGTAGAVIALLAVAVLSIRADAGPLLVSGSSTFQKRILEPAQKTLAQKTGVQLEITGAGSIRGLKDLMKGEAAAATVSCPLGVALQVTGIPPTGTFQEHVIMQDLVVPIVHPSNKVKSLTADQLADIHSGKITNWKDVGGPDSRIVVVAPPAGSGTRALLRDDVLHGAEFVSGAYVTVTDREAVDVVALSPIAIAMLSEAFAKAPGAKVKVVKAPPLKRPLSIITRDELSAELTAVIRFLQSKEAKKLFK
jgi:phosphate transport system substrate-binding protein